MQIYGLFKHTYDYHEWENLECVSRNKEKLLKKALEIIESENPLYGCKEVIEEDSDTYLRKYNFFMDNEQCHLQIRKLEVI